MQNAYADDVVLWTAVEAARCAADELQSGGGPRTGACCSCSTTTGGPDARTARRRPPGCSPMSRPAPVTYASTRPWPGWPSTSRGSPLAFRKRGVFLTGSAPEEVYAAAAAVAGRLTSVYPGRPISPKVQFLLEERFPPADA